MDTPGVLKQFSSRILFDINNYAIKTYFEPHRWHLGASLIGHECARYLWFTFRWCGQDGGKGETIEDQTNDFGRRLRLFNRGHLEENRYADYLRGIGCEVKTHSDDGKQFRMTAVEGHFGGSLDFIIKLPARYGIDEWILGEAKTNNTGSGFTNLTSHGVAIEKMQHYVQMSCYGKEYGFRYALYLNTNKNDDDMHVELVKLDWHLAEQMRNKAEKIIYSKSPPPRLSENPTHYKCKFCTFAKVCHGDAKPERNCRSCVNAKPAENAEWFCSHWNAIIPRDAVPQACESYSALPTK